MKTHIAAALFTLAAIDAAAAEVKLTPAPAASPALVEGVLHADAALFEAVFDTCDVDALAGMVTPDFEFFHDKHGQIADSDRQFLDAVRDKCVGQREGRNFLSRRELVADSVRVYPLNDYGAIEVGEHRFYAIAEDTPDRLTETGKFTHVWKRDGDTWRLARVLSYDHVLAE